MKTLKVMSIIGLVFAGLGLYVFYTFDTSILDDAEAISGWLVIISMWLVAQSIVSIVQSKKNK